MELSEIISQLTAYFPPEDHKERKLKGNGTWYYLPHQVIRDRLNELCPGEWSTDYSLAQVIDGEPVYLCKLTICGVTRTGIGDKSNEPSPYGTSAQRAFRKAFTDAAEQFGIGAYLDEQTNPKTKQAFVRYMQQAGRGDVVVNYRKNEGVAVDRPSSSPPAKPFGQKPASPKTQPTEGQQTGSVISDAQRKRLWAIAKNNGKFTDAGIKRLIEAFGFDSTKSITSDKYNEICEEAQSPEKGAFYNEEPISKESIAS